MSDKTISDIKLRQLAENDYVGLLKLKNLIYPDHPISLKSFRHHEDTRPAKIQHKHWVMEKDSAIFCSVLYTQWEEIYHTNKFVIKIYVHPDLQERGYGTYCYDFIITELEPLDPIKMSMNVHEPHTHSVRFMEKRGFINTFMERESSLDLTIYDPKLYQEKLDSVLQQGFRIITLAEFRK